MRLLFLCCLLIIPALTFAQVVNTEKLRLDNEEDKWTGEIGTNFGLSRNKAGQTLALGTRLRLEYKSGASRWMLLGAYNLTQFNNIDVPGSAPKNFTNNAFGHLRYNHALNGRLTWEAFAQAQYDEIQQLDIRTLAGTGPRIQIMESDSSQLYWGILYMYEHEESYNLLENAMQQPVVLDDHRISTYLSGGFSITDFFAINAVVYYQPRLDKWGDFRIASETTLSVNITEKLLFNTYFQVIYDDDPPAPVPNTMYVLRNGLEVSF